LIEESEIKSTPGICPGDRTGSAFCADRHIYKLFGERNQKIFIVKLLGAQISAVGIRIQLFEGGPNSVLADRFDERNYRILLGSFDGTGERNGPLVTANREQEQPTKE